MGTNAQDHPDDGPQPSRLDIYTPALMNVLTNGPLVTHYDGTNASDGLVGTGFGSGGIANVSDANLDGINDYAVGAPLSASETPRIFVYDGKTHELLVTMTTGAATDGFGAAIANGSFTFSYDASGTSHGVVGSPGAGGDAGALKILRLPVSRAVCGNNQV